MNDNLIIATNKSLMPRRCDNVIAIMRHVQGCPWNPFKLNEIVTLERCLQEATCDDPRLSTIFRKLATECVFVEPSRKMKHLSRDDNSKNNDTNLAKETRIIRKEIEKLEEEIDFYRKKLDELSEGEEETNSQLPLLSDSILTLEKQSDSSLEKLGFMLDRVMISFDKSSTIIENKIPNYIDCVPQFSFIKMFGNSYEVYRRVLAKLVKDGTHYQQNQQLSTQLSYYTKEVISKELENYLEVITILFRDLVLIDKVYSSEIPEEIEYLKGLNTHIEYLEKPPQIEAPKKLSVVYHDLQHIEKDDELVVGRLPGPPRKSQDLEFNQLFKDLSDRLKVE